MTFSTLFARLLRLVLFVGALVMLPSPAQGQDNVANFLDCVTVNSSTNQKTAFFGYSNPTSTPKSNEAGSSTNFIVPGVPDQGQPSVFSPGTHHYAFSVTFTSTQRVWVLGPSYAIGDSNSPRCLSQTFTYQGRLTEGSTAASGTYEMQFKLFDDATGSNQIGTAVENNNVTVVGGVFTVPINVLSATAFAGSDRFLEIWVKRPADASFTLLSPRQPITATPYAIHSQSATVAETAINASMLSSRPIGDLVLNSDSRLSNPRAPTAGSSNYIQNTTGQQAANFNIGGSGVINGNLTVNGTLSANWAGGSANYIQNGTSPQTANFSVSGDGTALGTLTGSIVNATTQYNLANNRVLSLGNPSQFNTFVGINAGQANPTGIGNAFFGTSSGLMNTVGSVNSFFGLEAGMSNVNGVDNAFFGAAAGKQNTASDNSFFGAEAGGFNTTGADNASVGRRAGFYNTTGSGNTFIGKATGWSNTSEDNNTFVGFNATGAAGITNATAIGAFAHVTRSNAVVIGSTLNDNGAPTGIDVGIGTTNPQSRLHVVGNVRIDGNLSKSSGSFQIDHPLDPANKYLYHSFVESPDMMNIYNGNVVLDRRGQAVITLPEWFQALNRDFRYQLTCIGGFAQVYVAAEVRDNRFKIAGGKPGMKVSWQVTGVRHDAYAEANRIPVEENKPAEERGTFLHPELFLRRSASAGKAKRSARQ